MFSLFQKVWLAAKLAIWLMLRCFYQQCQWIFVARLPPENQNPFKITVIMANRCGFKSVAHEWLCHFQTKMARGLRWFLGPPGRDRIRESNEETFTKRLRISFSVFPIVLTKSREDEWNISPTGRKPKVMESKFPNLGTSYCCFSGTESQLTISRSSTLNDHFVPLKTGSFPCTESSMLLGYEWRRW